MKHLVSAPALVLFLLVTGAVPAAPALSGPRAPAPWRSGWCFPREPAKTAACAEALGFSALISHGSEERMRALCTEARARGIDTYFWFSLIPPGDEMRASVQVMSEADSRRLKELKEDADPTKHGYQFGGEPLPGHHDVLTTSILCFHRPEVVQYCRERLRSIVDAEPGLAGVAFDYFGYQNYRCCHCPVSEARFEAFRTAHPDLGLVEARVRFARDSLVEFSNALAQYVRSLRRGLKVATHVYPVFLPEPLYANRLDVDYCCQTAAWFFKPYWPVAKVERYARSIVHSYGASYRQACGVPFVGVYVGRPYADKAPERFAEELRTIFGATGTTRLSLYDFGVIVDHEPMRLVLERALAPVVRP